MNFAELVEDVVENLALAPGNRAVTTGEIKRLLNRAQREISLEVGLPTLYLDIPATGYVTGSFLLPTRFHPEGVLYAEAVDITDGWGQGSAHNYQLAILSPSEANTHHPRWEDDSDVPYYGPPFLVYNPSMPDAGFRPVNITTAKYRFLVHAIPEEMVESTDEPFAALDYCDPDAPVRYAGAMPTYHRVLSYFVTHELLQRIGDERWQAYFARYRDLKLQMFSQITPPQIYVPRVRSGRNVKRHA